MVKTAVFPGSFNPFHVGHLEIIEKALKVFDKVIIAQGVNPDKKSSTTIASVLPMMSEETKQKTEFCVFKGSLPNFVREHNADAVIRGLRNATDLEAETVQQYWYEDLGLNVPIYYIICGRDKRHISSSALRAVEKVLQETS
jgi:pantetheine-phosphate adenylyltransferase